MILDFSSLSSFLSGMDAFVHWTDELLHRFIKLAYLCSTSIFWQDANEVSVVADVWETLFWWHRFFFPGRQPSPLVHLVMIPAEVNSRPGPLSSDTFFSRIGDGGQMDLDFWLENSSSGAPLTVTYFSCEKFFTRIRDDAVMQWFLETIDRAAVPAAPHSQWCPFLLKNLMPDLEIIHGSPEAADWTAAWAVTWTTPQNLWN